MNIPTNLLPQYIEYYKSIQPHVSYPLLYQNVSLNIHRVVYIFHLSSPFQGKTWHVRILLRIFYKVHSLLKAVTVDINCKTIS